MCIRLTLSHLNIALPHGRASVAAVAVVSGQRYITYREHRPKYICASVTGNALLIDRQ